MSSGETRNPVTVHIAGEAHVLRSSAEPDYTRRCAEFLDEQVTKVRRASHLPDSHRAVILAALSITDRYFQTLDDLERLREDTALRSRALAERLERELDPTDASP